MEGRRSAQAFTLQQRDLCHTLGLRLATECRATFKILPVPLKFDVTRRRPGLLKARLATAGFRTTMRNKVSSPSTPRRRQSGVALLALSVLLVIVSVGLLVEKLSTRSQGNTARERSSNQVLAQAKTNLIAWSVSHPNEPGRLPWPDRNGDGDYDGGSDCVTTGFSNTHLLGRFPHAGDVVPCDAVPFGSFTVDGYGEPLWYAVSQNLLWNRGQTGTDPPLNPELLDASAPYPWLTVRDENGNVVSNRVAAVIIAAGGVVGNQARTGAAPDPDQYLDSVTVGATTYDNSGADLDFIFYPDSRKTTTDSDSFNDQLIYITIDELMRSVEKRVLGDAAVALQTYRANRGRYPWLSPYRDPRSATGGQTVTGRLEVVDGGGKNITDNDADFCNDGVEKDDLIVNVTRRTSTKVKKCESATELDIDHDIDFEVGHAYNVLPAFNGVWGGLDGVTGDGREGHIPFIDVSAAESYAVSTGFTLSWNNGTTSTPPTCLPLESYLFFTSTGCDQLQNSYQSGSFTQPLPEVPASGDAGGECIWTDLDTADCFCHTPDCNQTTETRNAAYTVELNCVGLCAGTIISVPVKRTFTYTFDYTGSGATTSVGNVKTRQVTNTAPQTIEMTDQITVLGFTYTIWNGTVTVPPDSYVMDGIYFDMEDGNEFPGYFFTNLWHHYIYVKIAADQVAVNTITGNPSTDSCVAGTDCIELRINGNTVREDIQAALVGAGGTLAGQDRSDGEMKDYFEDKNKDDGNDTVERAVAASDFNDQVRVIRPNLP